MKNLILFFTLCLVNIFPSFGQGNDVIIWIDNSESVDAVEFAKMKISIDNIISEVSSFCNDTRFAVVHYGQENNISKIYIEDPNNDGAFTTNIVEAKNFIRRTNLVGSGDSAHEALYLIGNAIDNVANPNIVSPQSTLNYSQARNLIIFLFTDATRDDGIVNPLNINLNTFAAFTNYATFKSFRNAKFVVAAVPDPQSFSPIQDQNALAVVSSYSPIGNYNLTIESYPNEPSMNMLPRLFTMLNDFAITNTELQEIGNNICSCPVTLTLMSPNDDLNNTSINSLKLRERSDWIRASNVIGFGDNAYQNGVVYHAGNFVDLTPGFDAILSSQFEAYPEGCSGIYVYKNSNSNTTSNSIDSIRDVKETLTINPNPSNSSIEILLNNNSFDKIEIVSIDGKKVYESAIESSNKLQVDVSNFANGLYIVTVTVSEGQQFSKKLIKN